MGAHQNVFQRAVILLVAVIGALLDSAFNGFVGVAVHRKTSFGIATPIVWRGGGEIYAVFMDIIPNMWYDEANYEIVR